MTVTVCQITIPKHTTQPQQANQCSELTD